MLQVERFTLHWSLGVWGHSSRGQNGPKHSEFVQAGRSGHGVSVAAHSGELVPPYRFGLFWEKCASFRKIMWMQINKKKKRKGEKKTHIIYEGVVQGNIEANSELFTPTLAQTLSGCGTAASLTSLPCSKIIMQECKMGIWWLRHQSCTHAACKERSPGGRTKHTACARGVTQKVPTPTASNCASCLGVVKGTNTKGVSESLIIRTGFSRRPVNLWTRSLNLKDCVTVCTANHTLLFQTLYLVRKMEELCHSWEREKQMWYTGTDDEPQQTMADLSFLRFQLFPGRVWMLGHTDKSPSLTF